MARHRDLIIQCPTRLVALLVVVAGFATGLASVTSARALSGDCAQAQALERLGRLSAAEAVYLRGLRTPASAKCARRGLVRLDVQGAPCAQAKALSAAGERADAHAAYLKALAVDPSSSCAAQGVRQTRASTSGWSWFRDAATNAGLAFAAIALALLVLAVVTLLLLQAQTRLPWLRDLPPARGIRRPTLNVRAFDDAALDKRLGASTAGLIRGQVSGRSDRFTVDLVSGQAGIAAALSDLGSISGESKAAVAVINFLTALLPRRRFLLTGEMQPAGAEGVGISLELGNNGGCEALITFWAAPLDLAGAEPARVYQSLAVASAAWVDHRMVTAVGGDELLTADPQSWAYFRCGVDAQRLGEGRRARLLYRAALTRDATNVGALANLGIIHRSFNEYDSAEHYLMRALKAAEDVRVPPKLPRSLNPDWYRIKYQLAALYLNWAADREESSARRGDRAEKALTFAAEVAREALKTLQRQPTSFRTPVSPQFVEDTLEPFLRGTIEASVLVLVACAVDHIPDPPAPGSYESAGRADILAVLESGQIDPWPLVRYVESGDQHPPNAMFELACFYTRARDLGKAAEWLMRAVQETPEPEQEILIQVAEDDPTLAFLREARPGLLPKLRKGFGEGTLDSAGEVLVDEFMFQSRICDWLGEGGWSTAWVDRHSAFALVARKDGSHLLVRIGASGPLTQEEVFAMIGAIGSYRVDNPDAVTVQAWIVLPDEPDPEQGIEYAHAEREGVVVQKAIGGTFKVYPGGVR